MTSLAPRDLYSHEELEKLYPSNLKIRLVQVLLRHGERTPVSSRFQNAGLVPFWPYCSVARSLLSSTMDNKSSNWGSLQWRRRLETFGSDDRPKLATGPRGEIDSVCNLGELTDNGRASTHALGRRLRHLYVDQLHFMPPTIQNADMIYLRTTPIPRALESLQETFWGMYPSTSRTSPFPPPTIITRAFSDETLFPNDGNCRRFAQLSRAFAQRTADRWNNTTDMEYLNKLIGKWMPETSKRVAVDSRPRLSGIMDTINSTLAHGPETRLPKEFYDSKGIEIIEKIVVEEWFSGFKESEEYRSLGIGGLMGDIVSRMVGSVEKNGSDDLWEVEGRTGSKGIGCVGETAIKLELNGCHDTTLGAILAGLGAFENQNWPPYTSHIALELFQKVETSEEHARQNQNLELASMDSAGVNAGTSFFGRILGSSLPGVAQKPMSISRKKINELSVAEKARLEGYYVRLRYNDAPVIIPGCQVPGNHLDGDDSFCTLEAFKAIVDKFTPAHWKQECANNANAPAFPSKPEPAGY